MPDELHTDAAGNEPADRSTLVVEAIEAATGLDPTAIELPLSRAT